MPHKHNPNIADITLKAYEIRKSIIEMLTEAKSGHTAGAMGMADVFAALYFEILNITPQEPQDTNRDRLVLSNGHICPVLYATLAHRGFFDKKELNTLRKLNSKLQGHPLLGSLPGIETTSGLLGQGLSIAIGMAMAARADDKHYRTYCVTGDGELQEGQIWEAAMFAPSKKVTNLTWIIDRNYIQIEGHTEEVQPLENLREKLESFNWYVIEIDGHNVEEIVNACRMAKSISERPTVIIAHTVPGKGVDFMEYKVEWHGKPPEKEQAKKALKELATLQGKIKAEYD